MERVQALQRLNVPMKIDPAGLVQQSICYDKIRSWTVSVSWGYAVQIFRGIFSPREIEQPARTFTNWYKKADFIGYEFNTRPVNRHPCQKPFVYYLTNAAYNKNTNNTATEYVRDQGPNPQCNWKMANPSRIDRVQVYKAYDPHIWDKVINLKKILVLVFHHKTREALIDMRLIFSSHLIHFIQLVGTHY